jgi:hypothetical protein
MVAEWNEGMMEDFEQTLLRALSEDCEKIVVKSCVTTLQTIVIKGKNKRFLIEGMGPGIVIEGRGHSVFQITGKGSCITLKNLHLSHTAIARDKRDLGGAVFVMGTAQSVLEDCNVTSLCGFGIWGVQSAHITLVKCSLYSRERSGGVLFGKSSLFVNSSHITRCGQHGICVRGSVNLIIVDSLIDYCQVRGIYAYDKSHVSITSSTISFTQSEKHSAVEFWGGVPSPSVESSQQVKNDSKCLPERRFRRSSSPERDLSAKMENVLFISNKGTSICCQDNVQLDLSNCFYYSLPLDMCRLITPFRLLPAFDSHPIHSTHNLVRRVCSDQITSNGANLSPSDYQENSLSFLKYFSTSRVANETNLIRWAYLQNDCQWIEYSPDLHSYLSIRFYEHLTGRAEGNCQDSAITFLPQPFGIYRIDFETFEQMNVETHFVRSIRWSRL